MTRERVVIDTNVLISGLFSTTSTPGKAVEKAATKAQLVATIETLRELIEQNRLETEIHPATTAVLDTAVFHPVTRRTFLAGLSAGSRRAGSSARSSWSPSW